MTDEATPSAGPEVLSSGQVAEDVALAIYGDAYKTIYQYVDILAGRGMAWGLIGPRERDRLWERHVLNSAALADLMATGSRVVDVGSGAGLPGIPLAILRPDLRMTLLEPLQRRAEFLSLAVDELDLADRVTVVRGRAEDCRDSFDIVTCRAVAALTKLVEWCGPLFLPDGELIALKGASAPAEVHKAAKELKKRRLVAEVLQVRVHPAVEGTTALRITQAG